MAHFKLPPLRVHLFGYIFSPRWIPTIATFLILPILVNLGMWQIHRADEKKKLEHDFARQMTPLKISDIKNPNDKNLRYRQLKVTGTFDNAHQIFLDNKTYHQKTGYHVLTPFILQDDKRLLLVNRGFLATKNRSPVPNIESPKGIQTLTGLIYFPSRSFMLGKESTTTKWPLILQTMDFDKLEKKLNQNTYPFYLLLQSGEESNLVRDWKPVNLPSYRHMGYAIQWFLLALTVIVIYIVLNISRAES